MALDPDKIEQKLDLVKAGAMVVSDTAGGLMFQNMMEVMEFAKLMCLSQTAVPKHLRNNPGACLAICVQATEWRMSPFSVANKSYEVNDRIAYESQLITAVINARAPLQSRLRYKYDGTGTDMKCTITGLMKGEATPLEYESPAIKDIKVKNSPLWTSDPKQQLGYYASRAWARRHCPEVILGIYADDELDGSIGHENAKDITPRPDVASRLNGKKDRGFSAAHVTAQIGHKPEQAVDTAIPSDTKQTASADAAKPAEEQQLSLSAGDVETELAGKRKALENCESESDVKVIAEQVTAFLKQNNRADLLADFLSLAEKRGKKLHGKAPVAA